MARSPIASDEFLKRLDELEKQRDERNRHESIRGTEREAKNNPVASDSFLKRLDELTEQRRAQREQEEKQKKLEDVKQRLQFLPEQLRANRTNARRAPIEEETAARMRAQRNAAAETNPVAEALARANEAYRAGGTVQRTPGTETAARRAARTAGLTPDAGTLLSQMTARITGTELSPTGYTADPQRVLSSMTATEAERQRRAREEAAETEAEIAARRAVEVFASRKAQERREAENARIREEQARQEKPMTAKEALEATRQEETLGLSAPGYRAAETPELDRETVEAFNKASNPGGTLGRALDVLIGDPFEAMSAGAGRAFEAMAADNPNAALLALGGLAEDINRAQNGRGGAGARSSEAEAELFHSAVIEPLQKQAEEEKEAFDAQYAQRLEHAGRDGGKTYGTFMQAFGELGRMLTSSGMAQAALGQPLATLAGAGMGRYSEMAGTALKNLSNFAISAGAAGQSYLEATAAGANAPESAAYAILSGALEYGTNKLFGGNPIEDADAGAVNRLIGKFAHDERLLRLLGSMPVELVGEGMEEVISEALGPVLQRLTYDPHASMATLDQLLEAGIQGVLVAGLAEGGDALASIPGRLRADRESGAPVATEEQEPLQNGPARDMLQPEAAATAQASAANDRQINSPLQSESVQEEIERVPGTYEGTDAGAPVEYERAGATPANETATATETERGGEDNVREENRAEWAREETQSTGDDDLRRGRGERVDSPHSGIEAERLEGRTGGGEERREPGARRGNRARDVALSYAPLRSTREYLGLADGSETTALREAPESYVEQDEELRSISQAVRQRGYTPHLFTGRPELGDGRAVNGLVRDGDVFLRIDSAKWSATQIWDHERFHLMQMEDPGLVERVKRAVLDKYGEQELRARLETYLKAYAGSYGINLQGIADWDDAGVDTVLEELLADAYAGMDTQGVGVGEYRQTVIDSAEARQAAAYTDYAGAEAQRDAENPDSEGAVMADGPASEWAGGPVDPSFAETLERTNGGEDVRYSMNRANGTAEDTTERPETFEQYVSENAKRLIRDEVTMRELREEWDRGTLRYPERESPAVQRMRDEAIQRLTGEAAREQTETTHELAETIRDEAREREQTRQIVRSMHIPKAEFEGTPALQKLGVRIEDRLGLFSRAEGLRQNDAAAKSVRRETEKAERRLAKEARATKGVSGTEIERIIEAERNFAQGIANGVYDQADIPRTLNEDRVLELADYYIAERAVNSDLIGRQRREITMDLDGAVEEIMSSVRAGETEIKKSGAWTINHRTPERNMRRIFGDETGEAVNDFIFRPVQINESERLRFVNRMYDEVRTFEDSTGKVSELSKHERAVVQWLMEGKGAERQLRELGQQRQEEILDCARHAQRAESLREMNQDIYDDIRNLHLTMQEADLVRRLALRDLANKEMEEGSVDRAKMDNARSKYEEMYDTFYNAINDFLVVHGYEPIGFVSGYAPHFQSDETYSALERAIKQMGGQVSALPNAIAGLTKGFRPNKRWDPYLLKRRGIETDYDVAAGYERYVDYMSDILYHTDDIMRTRALARSLRSIGSDEETRERLEWISHLRETDDKATVRAALEAAGYIQQGDVVSDERMEALLSEYVDKVHDELKDRKTKYGDVVTWLDDYANSLASKQVMADRDMERSMGRVTLNVGQRLVDWFARAQVAGNVSSAFNQAAQLPQIGAEVGTVNLARAVGSLAAENIRMVRQDIGERNFGAAIADLFSGAMRKGAWAQESDFLTEKQGVNFIVNTPSQMIMSAAFKPLEFMDSLVSTLAVRGKYLQEIHKGQTHEQAMKTADSFGRNVMGSRAKGTVPLAFKSKNLINKMLNMFQIEAFNSWEHLSQDVLGKDFREIERTRGRRAAAASAAGVFVKMLLAAFVLNRLDEELYGGTPAPFDLFGLGANFIASGEGLTTNDLLRTTFDDVWEQLTGDRLFDTDAEATDGEFNWDNALEDTWYNLSNEIPFLRNASALLGWGDDTLPLPDLSGVTDAGKSNGPFSSEVARQLLGVAADMMPFGRQLEKTAQGLEAVLRGGRFKGYGDNARLQYPVSDDFGTLVRAMLFGLSALPEGDAFYASGQSALSAKQTQIYSELVDDGADRDVVYRTMQAWREAGNDDTLDNEEKNLARRNIIRDADLTDEQKLMLFSGLNGSSSQSKTFQTLMDTGLSWDQIMDAYETYTEIRGSDGLSAYERATGFSNWVEEQEFEPEQEESIRELLKISASKTQYDKLKDAGLSAEEASSLSEQLGQLTPESGKANVSNLQKLRVVVDSGLSRKKKQQAVRSMLSDSAAERFDYLIEAGITPETYVDFREAVDGLQSDTDGEGKTIPGSKKEKVLRAIDALDLTNKQKTALYYASGYSESGLEDVNWSTRGLSLPSLDAWREDSAEPEGLRLPSVG